MWKTFKFNRHWKQVALLKLNEVYKSFHMIYNGKLIIKHSHALNQMALMLIAQLTMR